jgi:hypothetical protein
VRGIQDWVLQKLGSKSFLPSLGVMTINEQTVYVVPGQSHTSRHASIELRYAAETGDLRNKDMAVRQLNWATYFVDDDGKNKYPDPNTFEIWWTDGYGDFVRHFLRSMAVDPLLAPPRQSHLLHSTSAVCHVKYSPRRIDYELFDSEATSMLHLASKPSSVMADSREIPLLTESGKVGWTWQALPSGGIAHIYQRAGHNVTIVF